MVEAEEDEEEEATCVVCMQPMEWVAVAPCGHREVCVRCAASIRFFHKDLRCCICRSRCSTVFVTKASGQRRGGLFFPFFLIWAPPRAFASEQVLLAGDYYWYHRGMGAYFDDVCQYQQMSKVCTRASPPTPSSTAAAGATTTTVVVNYPGAQPQPEPAAAAASVNNVNLNVSVVSPSQAAATAEEPSSSDAGFLMVARHPYPKILIVLPVSVLVPAFTVCAIYAWRKFSNNSLQRG